MGIIFNTRAKGVSIKSRSGNPCFMGMIFNTRQMMVVCARGMVKYVR